MVKGKVIFEDEEHSAQDSVTTAWHALENDE